MAIKRLKPKWMSVGWFVALPDHPRQRDTERHAKKARKRHLKKACITQEEVVVARYSGSECKVDAHTRALLWGAGLLPKPDKVWVTRFSCDTTADLNELYATYDNKDATETPKDLAYGRLHELGMSDIHNTLADHARSVSVELLRLQTGVPKPPEGMERDAMVMWLEQYHHFNDCAQDKKRRKTHSAFTAAEFITHRLYGAEKSDEYCATRYQRQRQ